ncbi:MAG: hypothetical protein HKM02_12375 [Pseudomonadales bacterium]|nr:hypothetical protein [Pseudomonadales bacterium]
MNLACISITGNTLNRLLLSHRTRALALALACLIFMVGNRISAWKLPLFYLSIHWIFFLHFLAIIHSSYFSAGITMLTVVPFLEHK